MIHLGRLESELSNLILSCEYWDIRIEDTFETNVVIMNGEVVTASVSPSVGAFVRVRKNGFWFYEATTEISNLKTILTNLSQQDFSSQKDLKPFQAQKYDEFISLVPIEKSFRNVAISKKIELVQRYSEQIQAHPKATTTTLRYKDVHKTKSFLNSVGTRYEYDFNQGGIQFVYTLNDGAEIFDDKTGIYGSEFSQLLNQEQKISEMLAESEKFIKAPAIQPGKYRVLMNPEVAGVFTHESFGHKSEADFMLGNDEAMKEWSLGKKIGADFLSIVDYGGLDKTSGYCPIDDEGTPAQKNYLIKNGILTGRLHTRETAYQLGENPTGNCRAINFEWEPIVRMTSTYIEPGTESLESILGRSEGAILVESFKHGSGLSTFTIAPTRSYRIRAGGEREPVRVAVVSGSVFETLQNIEAISSDFGLHNSALGGCGKMDQWPLPVSDGGPYVLVQDMQVS
jgi:TldD protein